VAVKIRVPFQAKSAIGARQTFDRLVLDAPDPTAVFDAQGHLLAANPAARREGSPGPASEGPPLTELLPFWTDDEGRVRLLEGLAEPLGLKNLEIRFRVYGEKQERVFWISADPAPGVGPGCFVATARDVSAKSAEIELLKICYEELATQSDRDPVTGFYSRERFRLILEREAARADRVARPLALLYVDLDDFKTLNDTHGHAAGDEYLFRLGEMLREELNASDLMGRFGGDEIAILVRDTDATAAAQEAEKLVAAFAKLTPEYDGRPLNLSASIGVAVYPEHAASPSDLVQAADVAMQQAKRRGRARFRVHDPHDEERARIGELRGQADRVRSALAEQRFVPVYQPVLDIQSGRIVSVETLVRLREDDGRLVSPGEFLDAAERFGFVTQIDRFVIASAFDALSAAHRRTFPDLEMNVNLSGHDFEDDELVAHISHLARSKWIRPDKVTFEITETAALRDLARVQHFTKALVAEGFRFALDDFGVGFSSFRYLRELPVASLKFDISYVKNLAVIEENRVFVRGIAEICRGLGIKTVAEGVETAEILNILKDLSVDRAQGHFVGRPAPELPTGEGVRRGGSRETNPKLKIPDLTKPPEPKGDTPR
jgi:diguanylate cyclase (GGDEF)-like protein